MTYAIVTVVVLIIDQLMKFWTTKNIPLDAVGSACADLIPGVIHMTNVHNYGAAFSILQDARWLLIAVTVAFVIAVIVLINQEIITGAAGKWLAVLVMAGAISNGIDRALYGYVVDMFELEFIRFAVFNIADIFITVGGILFCVYIILQKPEQSEGHGSSAGLLSGLFKKSAPQKSSGRRAAVRNDWDEDEFDSFDEEEESAGKRRVSETVKDEEPLRQSRSERRRSRAEALEAIPKRGEHKNIQEEFAPENPDDPFAEWNLDDFGEVELGEPAAEEAEPEQEPVREEAAVLPVQEEPAAEATPSLDFDDELSFSLDDILSEFNGND